MDVAARWAPAVGGLLLALWAGAAEGGIIVRQRSNGIPGRARDRAIPQTLTVGEKGFRIDERNPAGPTATAAAKNRYVIVRLDKEVIWEVDPELRCYVEQGFDYFRRERARAERDREQARKLVFERYAPEEREAELQRRRLRADGRRVVEVEGPVPGPAIAGKRTERTTILVNRHKVVEVFATRDIPEYKPPAALFEFYDKTGIFEEEIVAALKAIQGFPLRIYVHVDFFSVGAEVESEVEPGGVCEWPEDPKAFELPAGFVKVDELPKPSNGSAKEYRCPVCGRPVDRVRGIRGPSGEDVLFDSEEHMIEYVTKKRE